MRTVISEVLEELGHSVRLFDTGTAALAALQNGLQSDLLITDIGLPGGLDGYKLAAAYHQLTPHTPVLFITGYDPQRLPGNSLPRDSQILLKPFDLKTLAQRVSQLLAASAPSQAGPE